MPLTAALPAAQTAFEAEFERQLEGAVQSCTGASLSDFLELLVESGAGQEGSEPSEALEVLLAAADFERFALLVQRELAVREAAHQEAADMGF